MLLHTLTYALRMKYRKASIDRFKVCGWFYSELGANSLVRGDVIRVVCLAERQVSQQSIHALDVTHLKKIASCRKIDVELK